jgi:hypothetical protein
MTAPRAVVAVSAALFVATVILVVLGTGHRTPADTAGEGGVSGLGLSLAGVAFAVVGALLLSRVPGNVIGWIFCVIGLDLTLAVAGAAYTDYGGFAVSPALPGTRTGVLVDDVVGPPTFGLLAIALLLFPDGRLLSRRWRPALWLCVAGMTVGILGYTFRPGGGDAPYESVKNPLGIHGLFGLTDALSGFGWLFMGLGVVLAAIAMIIRLRRAHGVERLQLKWIAYAAALVGVVIVLDEISFWASVNSVASVRDLFLGLAFATFPIAAGIAILRYRLYEIDVVIRRTLVYGLLTATLAAVYLGSVLLLQAALGSVTSGSSLAVAVSTLAVAALFGPARSRIQAVVDRRFYRRKYDATRTLEQFSARLREEVDLDALGGELRSVVAETMQPAHVSLWLRAEQ